MLGRENPNPTIAPWEFNMWLSEAETITNLFRKLGSRAEKLMLTVLSTRVIRGQNFP